MWVISIPGASLLISPITMTLGPIVAYNVLFLLAPALACWSAYFLFRYITKSFWPSLIGGYFFGFSSYELSHLFGGHANLFLIFLIPFTVYVVLLHLNREIKHRALVLWLSCLLAVQFLFSTETFATMTVFGAVAIFLSFLLMPSAIRLRLRTTVLFTALAYGVAALYLSPFLYYTFNPGFPHVPRHSAELYSTAAPNFWTPTRVNMASRWLGSRGTFSGNITEAGSFIGLPLIAIISLFSIERWRNPEGKLLTLLLVLIGLASMGPALNVAGFSVPFSPGRLFEALPLLNNALPVRFMLHGSLVIALMVAIWIASTQSTWVKWGKLGLALISVVVLLPNVSPEWRVSVDTPAFFSSGLYRRYIRRDGTMLIIPPYDTRSMSLLWQAQTGMYFRLASGNTGPAEREFLEWPIVDALECTAVIPNYDTQLKSFLAANRVETIIVPGSARGLWEKRFLAIGAAPQEVGGAIVFQVPMNVLTSYRNVQSFEMEGLATLARFSALLLATDQYLSRGLNPATLSVRMLETLGLLPHWGCSDVSIYRAESGLWTYDLFRLNWLSNGMIGFTVNGSSRVLKPIIARYGRQAQNIYFSYPTKLSNNTLEGSSGELVMVFTRGGLTQSVRRANRGIEQLNR